MPAFNKISKKTFESTPQIKIVRMTRGMFKMCIDSNISALEKRV